VWGEPVLCAVAAESLQQRRNNHNLGASTAVPASTVAAVAAFSQGGRVAFAVAAAPEEEDNGEAEAEAAAGTSAATTAAGGGSATFGHACSPAGLAPVHEPAEPLPSSPLASSSSSSSTPSRALVALRGRCSFASKARVAQALGFAALVVLDHPHLDRPAGPAAPPRSEDAAQGADTTAAGAGAVRLAAQLETPPTPSLGEGCADVAVAVFMVPHAAGALIARALVPGAAAFEVRARHVCAGKGFAQRPRCVRGEQPR
jgi:hypothetical protein